MTEEKAREELREDILEVESLLGDRPDPWTARIVDTDTGEEIYSLTREEWQRS